MKIGTARYNLTPKGEFYLIGYRSSNRNYPATGIYDDIFCNSLLFDDGEKEVFIFSADFLEFEESMTNDVKEFLNNKYGIDKNLILFSATHNHSSIVSYHKGWYTNKFNAEYYNFLIETIEKSYLDCKNNKKLATAKIGSEIIEGYYDNRNHPGKLADNQVIVTKFYDSQDKEFAAIVNWAVHSTVINAENTVLTSELAGMVSKKLGEKLGYYPLMIVGAAADCSNRNLRQGNDFKELERVSSGLSDEINLIKLATDIELDKVSYVADTYHIEHDMKYVHEEVEGQIKELQKEANEFPNKAEGLNTRISNLKKIFLVNHFSLDVNYEVIKIGDLILYVFPGELGSDFGKTLKNIECNAIVCGYTNGYLEYFMPQSEYGLSFETIGSKIPKGEPEKIVENLLNMAKKLIFNNK